MIVDAVALQARLQPDRLAATDLATGRRWNYAAFDRAIAQCSAVLRDGYGCEPGDRIASLARNSVELVLLHLACARVGAIYVPLNWRMSALEIEALIQDAEPRLLVGDAFLQAIASDRARLTVPGLAAEIDAASPIDPARSDPEVPSLILYTSGTSGRPKGVLLSEHNIAETAADFSLLGRVTYRSVFLCDSPMFHVIGLVISVRAALLQGGAILVSDGFDAGRTLARLGDADLGISHYFCVPQMAQMLRQQPEFDPAPLRRLTGLFTGGAPHPEANIRAWLDDGIAIVDGFGMSEAGTVFGMPVERAVIAAKAGSVGVAPPGVETRIVDDDQRECGPDVPGELQLRGANLFGGYWRRPKETRAAFTRDGWFRTGDIATRDVDGFHRIVDRRKDMYISGGENVYPAEIEAALAGMPGLREVAVVGVTDPTWGEVGHVAVVRRPGAVIQEEDVLAYLAGRVARYKIPRHVTFLESLPRTGSAKVPKATLRTMLEP